MAQELRLGIIGAGRIGKVHARTIVNRVPEARLVAIADPQRSAAEALASELRVPRALADHRELLRDREIDAVLVCSSTDTHAAVVTEAAAAGTTGFPSSFGIPAVGLESAPVIAVSAIANSKIGRTIKLRFILILLLH